MHWNDYVHDIALHYLVLRGGSAVVCSKDICSLRSPASVISFIFRLFSLSFISFFYLPQHVKNQRDIRRF